MARSGRYVLRATGSAVAFWVGSVVLAVVVGTPLVLGQWRLLAFALAPALLIDWFLWVLLFRPAVHYDAERVVIVNIGRVHTLPWARVRGVTQRLSLVFDLDSGKPVSALGVQPPRRPGNVVSNFDRRNRLEYDDQANARILEAYLTSPRPTDEPVQHRWDLVPLIIGAVLVVAVAIEVLVGI